MDANRALGPSMMFEFTQSAYRAFGPLEHEAMASLAERGFRFSLDHVADLRFEPKELADRGFRAQGASEAPAQSRDRRAERHPFRRSRRPAGALGIDLVAERIESESMVIDLLDYDVRFGQGFCSRPRARCAPRP